MFLRVAQNLLFGGLWDFMGFLWEDYGILRVSDGVLWDIPLFCRSEPRKTRSAPTKVNNLQVRPYKKPVVRPFHLSKDAGKPSRPGDDRLPMLRKPQPFAIPEISYIWHECSCCKQTTFIRNHRFHELRSWWQWCGISGKRTGREQVITKSHDGISKLIWVDPGLDVKQRL